MFFDPLPVITSIFLSVVHQALCEPIVESITVFSVNDNVKAWANEIIVEKRINRKIRVGIEKENFDKIVADITPPKGGRSGEEKNQNWPKKTRHVSLAKRLKERYADLKLEASLKIYHNRRGAARCAAENIHKGLEMKGPFDSYSNEIKHDTTGLFVYAGLGCPRFAMEVAQSENTNPLPEYKEFLALIEYILEKHTTEDLDSSKPKYVPGQNMFLDLQFAFLYQSWIDFENQQDLIQMPAWLRDDQHVNEQFKKHLSRFVAEFHGRFYRYNSMVAMACGNYVRQLTVSLMEGENVIIHNQENVFRCLLAGIFDVEKMMSLSIKYGSSLIFERVGYADPDKKKLMNIYFISDVEAMGDTKGELLLSVPLVDFIADVEARIVLRKWSIPKRTEEEVKLEKEKTPVEVADEVMPYVKNEISKDTTKGTCFTLAYTPFDTVGRTGVDVVPLRSGIVNQAPVTYDAGRQLLLDYGLAFKGGPQGEEPAYEVRAMENKSVLRGLGGDAMEVDSTVEVKEG